jgi:hypothetical protein
MIRTRRSKASLKRPKPRLEEFKRLLIVCEGSKTEPNYLGEVCQAYRLSSANVEIAGSECDSAPITVFRYAQERFSLDPSFDEVYCVIDRDSHPTFDAAVSACRTHQSGRFRPICSYPCFEYWVLLHFRYTRAPIVATGALSPGDVALRMVREEWAEYSKGQKRCFGELNMNGKTDTAITNASQARRDAEATGEPNPSTDIDLLLKRLKDLANEQAVS